MKPLATLSHVTLLQDPITHRSRLDYLAKYFEKPVTFTVVSNDKGKLWTIRQVSFLGSEPAFLINGRGEAFPSPTEAARHINAQLAQVSVDA